MILKIKYEKSRRCSFDLYFDHSGFSYTMYVKNLTGELVKTRSSKADYYKVTVEAFRKFLTEQLVSINATYEVRRKL